MNRPCPDTCPVTINARPTFRPSIQLEKIGLATRLIYNLPYVVSWCQNKLAVNVIGVCRIVTTKGSAHNCVIIKMNRLEPVTLVLRSTKCWPVRVVTLLTSPFVLGISRTSRFYSMIWPKVPFFDIERQKWRAETKDLLIKWRIPPERQPST